MNMAKILVVDDSKLAAEMIEARLTSKGYEVRVAFSGEEALAQVRDDVPDLVVSDLMMPGMDGYELCQRLRRDPATAEVPIILLTSLGRISEKEAGFEAGADDYLVKPVVPAELELKVRVLLTRAKTARVVSEARVISVFSLRGGVGVTSLAVNLAVSLAQMWQVEVPLIDLALESGHGALMLDLKPKYTLAELARRAEESVDEQVLDGCLVHHESGVRLLASPPSPAQADLITPSLLHTVLPMLKGKFEYIVVDTASSFSEVTLAAFDLSDLIIVVLSPDLASLKVGTAAMDVFQALDYPKGRLAVVINWTFPRGGLPQKNIEAALGLPANAVIPYERTLFVEAINSGVPAVWGHPTASASMAIEQLAFQVSKPEMQKRKRESPSEMLLRVRERLS
jgi:pilus assembly protein CpaE